MLYIVDISYESDKNLIVGLSILDTDDNTVEYIKSHDFIKVYPKIEHLLGTKVYFEASKASKMMQGSTFIPEIVDKCNPHATPVLRHLLNGLDLYSMSDIRELGDRCTYYDKNTILSFALLLRKAKVLRDLYRRLTDVYKLVSSRESSVVEYNNNVYYYGFCYMRDRIIQTKRLGKRDVYSKRFVNLDGVVSFTDTQNGTYLLEFSDSNYAKMMFCALKLEVYQESYIEALATMSDLLNIKEIGDIEVTKLRGSTLELKPQHFRPVVYLIKHRVLRR